MVNKNPHFADQDLLLLADGELPARRAARVRQHLTACWDCRTRMAEIEGTIGEFMRMHHQTLDHESPSVAGPRAQLKARLAELAQSAPHDPWRWLRFGLNTRALSLFGALALMSALGGVLLYWQTMKSAPGASVDAGPLPNSQLTPGATTAAAISEICSTHHDDVVRPVPSVLQQTVLQEYGMREAPSANYEIDFLISPGLGGAQDLRNLWPEPRYNTEWNSFVKDQLEDYLHQSVCGGRISLVTARRDIAVNWISAYKKYFHSEKPLTTNSPSDGGKTLIPTVSDSMPSARYLSNHPYWGSPRMHAAEWGGFSYLNPGVEGPGDFRSVPISVLWRARVASPLKSIKSETATAQVRFRALHSNSPSFQGFWIDRDLRMEFNENL
jgi:hypothetical protein